MNSTALPSRYALACVALVAALVATLAAWQLAADTPLALRLAFLGALAAPLIAAIPGLLRRQVYTAKWASLLTIVYIGLGLTETMASPDARASAGVMAGLSFALFGALVLAIRRARRE